MVNGKLPVPCLCNRFTIHYLPFGSPWTRRLTPQTWRFLCTIIAAVAFATSPAFATSLARLSLEQLTEASSAIIQGHVVSQGSEWNAAHTEIVTLTTITVEATAKGNTPATVVVEQLGGTIGRLRVDVPGTMHFFPQAKYELFLEPSAAHPSHYLLVGMRQGAYRIYRDPQTHEERVISPVGGAFYHETARGQGSNQIPAVMPLGQFQQRISSALSKPFVIPPGTVIPLVVRSVSFAGARRVQIEAETVRDVFPDPYTVIPAGSRVDGYGQESGGRWTLHWTAVSVRGFEARVTAENHAGSLAELQGEHMTVMTR